MRFPTRLSTVLSLTLILVSAVSAQSTPLWPDYTAELGKHTPECMSVLLRYSMTFNRCLRVPQLVAAVTHGLQVVHRSDMYLDQLCSSETPECIPEDLENASRETDEACGEEVKDNPGSVPNIMLLFVKNYDLIRSTLCAKNLRGQFCYTETLTVIQTAMGTNLTNLHMWEAMNGNSTHLDQLETILDTGALCTGCVSLILQAGDLFQIAGFPNVLPIVQGRCGDKFGTQKIPVGVAAPPEPTVSAAPSAVANDTQLELTSASGSCGLHSMSAEQLAGAVLFMALSVVV